MSGSLLVGIFQGLANGVHSWGGYSRAWPMGCTCTGLFEGLANGVHSWGGYSRDWPMGCTHREGILGIGQWGALAEGLSEG